MENQCCNCVHIICIRMCDERMRSGLFLNFNRGYRFFDFRLSNPDSDSATDVGYLEVRSFRGPDTASESISKKRNGQAAASPA